MPSVLCDARTVCESVSGAIRGREAAIFQMRHDQLQEVRLVF